MRILLNKNRGWRGLAELDCFDEKGEVINKMIFSFSPDVWRDLLEGYIVTQDDNNYIIIEFTDRKGLPTPGQQRSVLIKSFSAVPINVIYVPKYKIDNMTDLNIKTRIEHFRKNKNNHTTSEYNYIGLRVDYTI